MTSPDTALGLQAALTALAAAKARTPPPRDRAIPVSRAQHWSHIRESRVQEAICEAMEARAHRARGLLVGAHIGMGPLCPSNAYPLFLHELMNGGIGDGFDMPFDHPCVYRPVGARGRAGPNSTIVLSEPYLDAEKVPRLLAEWRDKLRAWGLTIAPLPADWRIYAPHDPAAHLFATYRP